MKKEEEKEENKEKKKKKKKKKRKKKKKKKKRPYFRPGKYAGIIRNVFLSCPAETQNHQ